MSEAKTFFENDELSTTKCTHLAKDYAQSLAWEAESVSDLSPGIVANTEELARQIHSPIHIDKDTDVVKVTAFSDAFDKGLSTNRLQYVEEELHQIGESKAETDRQNRDPNREYVGFVSARVDSIRSLCDEGTEQRTFGVYDTALESAHHHADICLIRPEAPSDVELPKKALKRQRRKKLQDLFSALNRPDNSV